jgi:uncharacterized OsmC-like protein
VADVEGRIEADGKLFRLAAVKLHYHFKVPAGKKAEADRALSNHEDYCPVHQSIKQGFAVTWTADVTES